LAVEAIKDSITNGGLEGTKSILLMRPNHDDSTGIIPGLASEYFGKDTFADPKDYGETRFGDDYQSPWEANAIIGSFRYVLGDVAVSYDENAGSHRYCARLTVIENLGVSPWDQGGWLIGPIIRARDNQLVTRALWNLEGIIDTN